MSGTVFPQGRIIAANGDFAAPWRMFMQNLYKATSGGASTALIPGTRTINGHALSADISLLATDVGAPSGSGTSTGTNTGDQTITLTGDVTGTGTGSFAATVGKIGGKTVSLAGSLTTSGAFASTFTMTGVTAVTFPTSGTLATLAGVETLTNKTLTAPVVNNPTGTMTLSSGSFGYAAGNGGTVTQATSKATTVTLNTLAGEITMNAAALAANTLVLFTLNNSTMAATDVMVVNHVAGGTNFGGYDVQGQCVIAGVGQIGVRNMTAGSLSEALVLRFVIVKGATT